MIEVFLIACGVAAGSAGLGFFAGRRARKLRAQLPSQRASSTPWPFPFAVRDVLSRTLDDELLVERAEVLRDGGEPTLVLLSGPAARGTTRLCVCFLPPREDALWLAPIELVVIGDPPRTYEHGGMVYERVRSIPITTGDDSPEDGMLAEYRAGASGRLLIVRTPHRTIAGVGDLVPLSSIDRLPGQSL